MDQNSQESPLISILMPKESIETILKAQADLARGMQICSDAQRVIAQTWNSALKVTSKRPAEDDLVDLKYESVAESVDATTTGAAVKVKRKRTKHEFPSEVTGYMIFSKQIREAGMPKEIEPGRQQLQFIAEKWRELSEEEKQRYREIAQVKSISILEQYKLDHPDDAEKIEKHREDLVKKYQGRNTAATASLMMSPSAGGADSEKVVEMDVPSSVSSDSSSSESESESEETASEQATDDEAPVLTSSQFAKANGKKQLQKKAIVPIQSSHTAQPTGKIAKKQKQQSGTDVTRTPAEKSQKHDLVKSGQTDVTPAALLSLPPSASKKASMPTPHSIEKQSSSESAADKEKKKNKKKHHKKENTPANNADVEA